jgi:hypothetical protein
MYINVYETWPYLCICLKIQNRWDLSLRSCFQRYENSFYPVKSMPIPCVMYSQRYNCSVVIMAGLLILQLAIRIRDGRPKKHFLCSSVDSIFLIWFIACSITAVILQAYISFCYSIYKIHILTLIFPIIL